nr:hypothetical protein [Tanacetum cinerariifolium]
MEHTFELSDTVPLTLHDSPLTGGYTPGSDEGRPNILELMNLCTQLSNRVLALAEAKTTQNKVITRLRLRVRRLEKQRKARTSQPRKRRLFAGRFKSSTDKSLCEDASKQGRNDENTKELNLTDEADTKVIIENKSNGEKGVSTADQVSIIGPKVSVVTPSTPPKTTTVFDDNFDKDDRSDSSEPSNDNTNVVNAPQEPFVVEQNPSENSSQSPLQINHHCCYECGDSLEDIFFHQCTYELCGKGTHYGYNCPPKVPIIPDPKLFNNQTINELPQTVPSFDSTCYPKDGNSFTYDSESNLS